MRIEPVSNQSFLAGNVYLKQVAENNVLNTDVLKKIAEKNDIDLWISKAKQTKYLPKNDMYTITAHQDLNIPPYTKRGVTVVLPQKTDNEKTVTEKLFGAIFEAIENLRNKI